MSTFFKKCNNNNAGYFCFVGPSWEERPLLRHQPQLPVWGLCGGVPERSDQEQPVAGVEAHQAEDARPLHRRPRQTHQSRSFRSRQQRVRYQFSYIQFPFLWPISHPKIHLKIQCALYRHMQFILAVVWAPTKPL